MSQHRVLHGIPLQNLTVLGKAKHRQPMYKGRQEVVLSCDDCPTDISPTPPTALLTKTLHSLASLGSRDPAPHGASCLFHSA